MLTWLQRQVHDVTVELIVELIYIYPLDLPIS